MSVKTIVVPYDFSECATDALRVPAKISRSTGAIIDVVHVYEQMTDFHTENQKLREEIEDRLERVAQLPFLQGVELKKFMLRQLSLNEMFRNERISAAELIVMGLTHRKVYFQIGFGDFYDSELYKMIASARCTYLLKGNIFQSPQKVDFLKFMPVQNGIVKRFGKHLHPSKTGMFEEHVF